MAATSTTANLSPLSPPSLDNKPYSFSYKNPSYLLFSLPSKTLIPKLSSSLTSKTLCTANCKNPIYEAISSNKLNPDDHFFYNDDKPREECGVVGIYGDPEASRLCYLALHALQHRGQEGAGIVTVHEKVLQSVTEEGEKARWKNLSEKVAGKVVGKVAGKSRRKKSPDKGSSSDTMLKERF